MAQVFEVNDLVSDRKLALKRLARAADRRSLALFEREYYTLTSLHHPNIVAVHDYGSDELGPFYTMELLQGSDVSKLAPLPWPEVCLMLRDVASALALIHARRYVHRDVSARNVWRTHDGQHKLIDFGTLAPFGKRSDVTGTPPFVAPEALHGRELDQRTDLFSLGALAYFLLTGRQAYPARTLQELEALWGQRPRPPSERVAELPRSDLPEVPAALDALTSALISLDERARPNDAAEVIDTLCAIAGVPADNRALVRESYLKTPLLVGRTKPMHLLRGALKRATEGRGASVVVDSAPSMGRTRLLSELAIQARMIGATVLQVEAGGERSPHGLAELYARKLLDALPTVALQAAQPHAAVLGHLSTLLRDRLGLAPGDLVALPKAHGEARMRLQAALSEWFIEVAREHTLLLLADDVHDFDPGAIAWLAALGRQSRERKLLIVASSLTDAPAPPAIEGLRRHATLVTLSPLAEQDVEVVLRSVFGDVEHLKRLADLVAQRAEGNPGDTLDLLQHMVEHRLVSFADGRWILPTSIAAEQLPGSPREVLAARVEALPTAARELARALSVREGTIPFSACGALAEKPNHLVFEALEQLVRAGILVGSAEGYRFTRDAVRRKLASELDEERLRRVHRISGELLLQTPNLPALARLEAGLHLLQGGNEARGTRLCARSGQHYALVDLAEVGMAAPQLERALELFRKLERPKHELLSLYAPLALAGYYAERKYADRYAEDTLQVLQELLGLRRARSLRKRLGGKLSLLVGLGSAAFSFAIRAWNPRVPKFRQALMMLFNCVAALTGVCTVCVDPVRAHRYADVLEPMRALGENHVATLMHDFCLNLAATVQDRIGVAHARWQSMLERLEQRTRIRDLPPDVHTLYLAGALYACGVIETWRDSPRALAFAQRLQDFGLKLYDLSANQLRMMYYANQGDFRLAAQYRERVEVHAIQRGTAWQAETWAFGAMATVYARAHDVVGVKHCLQQLQQLSAEVPTLQRLTRLAEGTFLMLRHAPEDAIRCLDVPEPPMEVSGWSRGRAVVASAHNELGQHARAKEVCLHVMSLFTEADFQFATITLNIPVQLALAEAGLGELTSAAARLDQLLEQHSPHEGPLTLSILHEARMRVAALMRDREGVRHHAELMEHWQKRSGARPLLAWGEQSAKAARALAGATIAPEPERPTLGDVTQPSTVMHQIRHGGDNSGRGGAEFVLAQLATHANVRAGHMFLWENERLRSVASCGVLPEPAEFEMWLMQRVANDLSDEETQTDAAAHGDTFVVNDRGYRLHRLYTSQGARLAGALVLSDETQYELPPALLRVIADRLHETIPAND